jgi:hypothetical protein
MKLKNILTYIILLVLFACEKEYQTNNISRNIVVEGYVSPGDSVGIQIFRILKYSGSDSVVTTVDTCAVDIFVNEKQFALNKLNNGYYRLKESSLAINEGDIIRMSFSVDGYSVSASTQIPSKPTNFKSSVTSVTMPDLSGGFNRGAFRQFEPIEITWDNKDNSYYLVAVKPVDENSELINPRDTINDGRRIRIFRNEPSVSSSYTMEPFQFRYFGKQYVILYHLNPEYASLYKFSGNTSLNITEPSTNVENGLGIFTGMNTDTLIINVIKQN